MRELQSCTDVVQGQLHVCGKAGRRLGQLVWEAMRLKCQHLLTHVQQSLLSRPDITDNPALYLIVSLQCFVNLTTMFVPVKTDAASQTTQHRTSLDVYSVC